jgi:nucleoside-diphosphate-sugar epimerase
MRRLIDARARGVDEIETGPLDSVRDFVDARDMASAIVAACTVPHLDASVVNIGSGTGRTAGELVRAIALRLGFNGAIREQASGSPRSLEVPWQVADVSLARRVLAWEPIHDFWSTVEFITGEDTQP